MKFQNLCKIIFLSASLIVFPALAQDEDAGASQEPTAQTAPTTDPSASQDLNKEIDAATAQPKNSAAEPEAAKSPLAEKKNHKKAHEKKAGKAHHTNKKTAKKHGKASKAKKAHKKH